MKTNRTLLLCALMFVSLATAVRAQNGAIAGGSASCCLPDGSCVVVESGSQCSALGGIANFTFPSCSQVICPSPTEACCLPDGSCADLLVAECAAAGGINSNPGLDCPSATCSVDSSDVACCFPDGSCADLSRDICVALGGAEGPPQSTCSATQCASPTGACCVATNPSCRVSTADECAAVGGEYQGDDTICSQNRCPVIERIDNSKKGSALIYSKVDLRWGPSGELVQDTILEISNDFPDDVYVQFYFVNGDAPTDAVFAGDPPQMIAEGEPGWNWVDCQTLLTMNQPMYWSAASGLPLGCQPFDILDPDGGSGPGRPDLESSNGGRVLRGYVVAWAVDAQGYPIRWNHLSGSATIVNYGASAAWEYNAWAAQRRDIVETCIAVDSGAGLHFDGVLYDAGFDVLLMDFYASGAQALSGGGFAVSSDTDLTLHAMSADLRRNSLGPVTTQAKFDIWNENERRFSGTTKCITCWDQTLLSGYDAPNHFLIQNLQTDKGKARIDGRSDNACDVDCVRAQFDQNGTDWGVCSNDTALIGVVARVLEFSGPLTGRRAMSGRSLVGAGMQKAAILYDVITPPGELRNDAYEAAGRLNNEQRLRRGEQKETRSNGIEQR